MSEVDEILGPVRGLVAALRASELDLARKLLAEQTRAKALEAERDELQVRFAKVEARSQNRQRYLVAWVCGECGNGQQPPTPPAIETSPLAPVPVDIAEQQLVELNDYLARKGRASATMTRLPSDARLVSVPNVPVAGWNRVAADVLFLAPAGFPFACPADVWVEPGGFRKHDGGYAEGFSHDNNPIPGDIVSNRSATWLALRTQSWSPQRDTLKTYFHMIVERLKLKADEPTPPAIPDSSAGAPRQTAAGQGEQTAGPTAAATETAPRRPR